MNSRERVLKAFRKLDGFSDRVPVQFDLCRVYRKNYLNKANNNFSFLCQFSKFFDHFSN